MGPKEIEQIEKVVTGILAKMNLDLYDISFPNKPGGVLRITVWNESEVPDSQGRRRGVDLDRCAEISRKVDQEIDTIVSEDFPFLLEVSSPGIERELSTPKHFSGAVGENVKVGLKTPIEIGEKKKKQGMIKGKLTNVSREELAIEMTEGVVRVPLSQVKKANVVFDFGSL